MQGVTGTFAINGTTLLLQPTEHYWDARNKVGDTGTGHAVYGGIRKYQLKWALMAADEYAQLQQFYDNTRTTGTVVVDLPKYATTPYQFYSYSGCTITEPTFSGFYEGYMSDVTLIVQRIRTY